MVARGLLAVLVVMSDAVVARWPPSSRAVLGLVDWASHLAVTTLALGMRATPVPPTVRWAAVVSTLAIDLDHAPALRPRRGPMARDVGRPGLHSALTPVAALAVSRARRGRGRDCFVGAAIGTATHLLRDACSDPGIPVLWPMATRALRLPEVLQPAALAVLIVR